MRRKWFGTLSAAKNALKNYPFGSSIFHKKKGANKGRYFIGYEIEFINLN